MSHVVGIDDRHVLPSAAFGAPPSLGVTGVVVTRNSMAQLERCLTRLSGSVDELVVVDNASTDAGPEFVRRSFPGARLIELERNVGFASACNAAIREASGRYVLLVNPDAWPIASAVTSLVDWADGNPRVGIAGPTLVNEDGSPQRSVFGYPRRVFSLVALAAIPALVSGVFVSWRHADNWSRRLARATREEAQPVGERMFLSGSVLLLRVDALEDVGGFDERFFFFSEEADLCFRMREAGWSVDVCPDATFVHIGGASSPVEWDWRYAELFRSYLVFLAKHQGLRRAQRARRLVVGVLSARAAFTPGQTGRQIRQAAARLRSSDLTRAM